MSVLAPQILEKEEISALLGKPPEELLEADLGYWSSVSDYGYCEIIENGTDCTQYLEDAAARKQTPKE